MSIFEKFYLQSRRGAIDSKLWISWPITLRAEDIDEIYQALLESFDANQIRMYVNVREVRIPPTGYGFAQPPSVVIPSAARARGVKSIAFVAKNTVWVHLGPRLPYVYSMSTEPDAVATLWKIQAILKRAKWGFGNFLFRSWGAAIMVAGVAIGAAFLFSSEAVGAARDWSALLILIALAVFLSSALFVGVFRRIRINVRYPGEKGGAFGGWLGATLTAIVVAAVGTLIASAVWAYVIGGK